MKKLPSNQKRPANKKASGGRSAPTCSRFWVIDLDTPGERNRSKSATGPFKSYAAAEKWIIDDARDTYADSSADLRNYQAEEWGCAVAIVEERRRLRPVPTAKISVRLMELSFENAKGEARADNASPPQDQTL